MDVGSHLAQRIGATGDQRRWWTLIAACLGVFMVLIDVTIVNVALPTLQRDLHAKFQELQWVVNAYAVPLAVVLVTAGRLSDLYGRRRIFVGGIAVFSTGSAIAGLSGLLHFGGISQIDVLLGARALQGIGGAVLVPVSLAIVSQAFEGHDKGTAIGIRGAMTGFGLASGPIVGGLLIVYLGWPTIFFINVPVGALAIALAYVAIDESRDESAQRAVDLWGTATLSCAVFLLVWGLIRLDGKTSGGIIGMGWPFIAAAAAFAAFIVAELRVPGPMVDLSLFKNRSYAGAAGTVFLLSAMMVGFIFFLTLYLQNALGFDALETGVRLLPMTVLAGFSAPFAGRFISRIGPRALIVAGMVLAAAGSYLVSLVGTRSTPHEWVWLLPSFVLIGLGIGCANAPLLTIAVGTVEPGKAGVASGVNSVCRQIGTAFGIAFLGVILTAHYNHEVPQVAQRAGPNAGSAGLAQAPRRVKQLPDFPHISKESRRAWISSFIATMEVGAFFGAAGAVLALVTIRKADLRE
jgi:EmrB/QacA subfamily drug resistance transporter